MWIFSCDTNIANVVLKTPIRLKLNYKENSNSELNTQNNATT